MHTCPNCGYCPHCGRSDRSYPVTPRPWPSPLPPLPRPWYYTYNGPPVTVTM